MSIEEVQSRGLLRTLSESGILASQDAHAAHSANRSLSLVEAIFRHFGDNRGSHVLSALAQSCGVALASESDLLKISEALLLSGGAELRRLICTHRCLPILVREAGAQRVLDIAVTDPCDSYSVNVFCGFFRAEPRLILARELDLQNALRQKAVTNPALSDICDKFGASVSSSSAPREGSESLHDLLLAAFNCAATRVEIEGSKAGSTALIFPAAGQLIPHGPGMPLDDLMRELLARAVLLQDEKTLVQGRAVLPFPDGSVSVDFGFYRSYQSNLGTKTNVAVLSNFRAYGAGAGLLEQSEPADSLASLIEVMSSTPGVYVAASTDPAGLQNFLTSLKQKFPDLLVANNPKAILADPLFERRVHYARYVIPIRATDVQHTFAPLENLPLELREHLAAIFAYLPLPQACPLCRCLCIASPRTLSLIPGGTKSKIIELPYPRGCPVCKQSGYIGTLQFLSVLPMDRAAGRVFMQGGSAKQALKVLQESRFRHLGHFALQAALTGRTTVEMVIRVLAKRDDVALHETRATGKHRSHNGVSGDLVEGHLTRSPFSESAIPSRRFHSVVIEMDDELMHERNALLEDTLENALGERATESQGAPKKKSGNKYHSLVLDLDEDSAAMRDKLNKDTKG